MKRFGISIHEAASFVIARRAMGFKEKLPPVLGALLPEKIIGSHHWVQWGYVSKILKDIHSHSFYLSELFDCRQVSPNRWTLLARVAFRLGSKKFVEIEK